AYTAPAAQITADSRFALFTIDPKRGEVERARQRKGEDPPRSSLGIMRLADGEVTVIPSVKSFRLAKRASGWTAYLLEKEKESAPPPADSAVQVPAAGAAATPGGEPRPIAAEADSTAKKKETGSTLALRELATGAEVRIADVTAYAFDEAGGWLGYTVSSKSGAADGAYLRSLPEGRTHTLLAGEGSYRGLVFDRAGSQVAFVAERGAPGADKPRMALYHARAGAAAQLAVDSTKLPAGAMVAEKAPLRFSADGRMLIFGVGPPPLDSVPRDSLAERAVFDLWHHEDARLQPQQRAEAEDDRSRARAAAYHVASRKVRVLGSDSLGEVRFSENARVGIASTSLPYAVEAMWGQGGSDVYLLDAMTGRRTLVAERVPFAATLSPGGNYVLYFGRDGRWRAFETASGRTRDVTGTLGVRFDQETWDTPSDPAPWGVAGWTSGDRSVLVYDRYDLWEIDPSGRRPAKVVTDSAGRRAKTVLRVVDLDEDAAWIDPAEPLLLRALDEETKAAGFWRDRLGSVAAPDRLWMGDVQVGTPAKARDAERYLFTRSTLQEFPDLWVSDGSLAPAARISDANPQQNEYRWAEVETVRWRSADGTELQGLLYRPEGFDPSRRYPMVVYFYEQLSQNLHQYRMDVPRNTIQPTLYASNGYLVFMPDIHYTEGYPGESALKSIVPGVQALIARGFVDPAAVGIQGQSWGGYQAAYIITRTPLFAAAMAGAPVANMTSAYGGIRWESGLARAFQYETGQSRIGGSLWEHPWRYVENSPLFAADRITTPLFIMHNDGDGAVPWYQGIEMFVALRRLGKEVYLINYNGDGHNPTKRANQLDMAARMLQFFDHHLRGKPAPSWMEEGIPFLERERETMAAPPPEVSLVPES
ncbi:MAG: prolyl oligopeptidase family serine peptidase, partial [Gemmatimonadota bacterium]|nr:prolyl oligopeptidase family serine peptidase [Gemmatimonadota bacterium]